MAATVALILALGLSVGAVSAHGAAVLSATERDAVENAAGRVAVAEFVDAINIMAATIETIEQRSDRYNAALVRPLVVLGDALAGVGDGDGAFGAYDRALHIARVNFGLHHPSQVDIVYREARLLAKSGDFESANRRHEYAYGVLLRSHGGDNPALLPGLFALADWYMSRYDLFSARALYEHAVQVAESKLDDHHPARIRALRSVATTYLNERFPPFYTRRSSGESTLGSYTGFQYRSSGTAVSSFAKGERALIEIINLVQTKDDASSEDVARAMLELGDWFLMFEKHARATSLYRRVWELLQDNAPLLAQTFDSPTPLYLPLPQNPKKPERAGDDDAKQGVIELSIDVDERGFVSRIDTLRSEPEQLMDFKVRRAVRRARYRPAFDGQTPQATSDLRVTHAFVYYPTAQADISRQQSAVADLATP